MTTAVTWELLRGLAAFRAQNGCAISFYLDLHPSVSPTRAEVEVRVHALADEVERFESSSRAELTHQQREGLRDDAARLRAFFEEDFSREGCHGYVVFAAGPDGVWRPVPLSERVPDLARVGRALSLGPLIPLVGRDTGALVAFVGRERGDLYQLVSGRLELLAERFDEQPGRHDQGGWSQARYQRHIEKLVRDHLRETAALVARHVRQLGKPQLVIVSTDETRPQFEEVLSREAKDVILGWAAAEAHAGPAELLEVVEPLLEGRRAEEEARVVKRWSAEAGRSGRATTGWAQTLEAISDGRVELLLFQEALERTAWECPACGRLAVEGGSCPLDGSELEESGDGVDLAIHQTLARAGTVWAVRERADLEQAEGVGALLRY
jgi:peptide chain release factor subunit 1